MYTAQILDQTFLLDPKQSTLNGAPQTMSITPLPDGGIVVQLNKQQLVADVVSIDKQQKTVTLRIKSQKVTVQIKEPVDLLLEQLGMQQSRVRKVNQLKAPMPGLVLRILVQEGQSVKAGDPLMVLEAMKMENVFKAPADVTVKQIKVSEKQAVEKNTELMTFA